MIRAINDLPALKCREYQLAATANRLGWLEPVPEAMRQDRQALWDRLNRDGYLFIRQAIDPQIVLEFRRYYFTALAPSGLTKSGSNPLDGVAAETDCDQAAAREVLFGHIVPGKLYEQFCNQPALRGLFEWLFAASVHLHKRKLIRHSRVGESWVTSAHYDLVYLREGTDNLLSAWIPLGDCPVERGGLIYLEQSHKPIKARDQLEAGKLRAQHITYNLPALAEEFDTRWLIADYEAGDLVIHSPFMVHASLNNTDPNGIMRLSTDIRYQPLEEQVDARWQNHWHDNDGL